MHAFVIDGDTKLISKDGEESFWVSSAVLQARGLWWSPCRLGMDLSVDSDSVIIIFPDHTKHELNNFVNKVNDDICSKSSRDDFHGFSANEIPSYRLGVEEDGQSIHVYKEKIPWRPWTSQSSVRSVNLRVPSSPRVTSTMQAMYKKSPVRPPLRDRIRSRRQERLRADRDRIVSGVRRISMAAGLGDQVRKVVKEVRALSTPSTVWKSGGSSVGEGDQNYDNHELQSEFEKRDQEGRYGGEDGYGGDEGGYLPDYCNNPPLVDSRPEAGDRNWDSRLEFCEDGSSGDTVSRYHNSPVSSERLPSQQLPEVEHADMTSSPEDISKFGGKSVSELGGSLGGDTPEIDQHQAGDVQEVPDEAAAAVQGDKICEICGKVCLNAKELLNHKRGHYFQECNLCGTKLKASSNLKYHMESCRKSPTIQCPQCEYKFVRPQALRRHLLTTCKGLPALEHKCDRCEFIGKSRGELRIHMREHPKFGCDHCGRKFRKQHKLQEHVEAHKAQTLVTSNGDWFKLDDGMLDPKIKEKEAKLYHCLQCSYKSKRPFNLKIHVLRVHERPKPQKINVKPKCTKCGFTSLSARNVRRHQLTCPGPRSGKITLQKVIDLCVDTNCSFTDVKKIRKLLFDTYGRGAVEPNVFIKLTKLLKDLSVWWTTEVIELQETSKSKKGQLGKTCVSYIKRLKQFEDWVIKGRGIKNPKVFYSFDGGQFKCVGVLNIHDLDRPGEPDIKGHLSTGSRLTLPFLQADMGRRFGENHYNVKKLLSLIEFPESADFQFGQDYKLKNIVLGIIGTNGRHPCAYATCYKVDEDGNPTTRRGLFHKTLVERSQQFQLEWNCKFNDPDDGNGNEAKMGEYFNCHKPPIILQKTNLHRRILLVHPPAPLHDFLLGPPNDLVTALGHRYPDIMPLFLDEKDCHPEGAGGKFAGPSIRTILAETNLVELGRRLPDNIGGQVMEYLGSLWRLYCVSMALKLCEHWRNYIADFSAAFLVMYYHEELLKNPPKFQVNCTLKVHCIMDHLGDFFLETGQTLRNVADDFVEVFHQQLRDNEKKHRLRTRRKLGTANHLARLNKSSIIITLKNLGFIPTDIPRYFRQVAAPFPDQLVEEIHRGGRAGGPEDEAEGEVAAGEVAAGEDAAGEDAAVPNDDPLPSHDAAGGVHNDHTYCFAKK